jgi:hypothetical protein
MDILKLKEAMKKAREILKEAVKVLVSKDTSPEEKGMARVNIRFANSLIRTMIELFRRK